MINLRHHHPCQNTRNIFNARERHCSYPLTLWFLSFTTNNRYTQYTRFRTGAILVITSWTFQTLPPFCGRWGKLWTTSRPLDAYTRGQCTKFSEKLDSQVISISLELQTSYVPLWKNPRRMKKHHFQGFELLSMTRLESSVFSVAIDWNPFGLSKEVCVSFLPQGT